MPSAANVTIKVAPSDYNLMMRCLEIVKEDMEEAANNTNREPKIRNDARQLALEVDALLRRLR